MQREEDREVRGKNESIRQEIGKGMKRQKILGTKGQGHEY